MSHKQGQRSQAELRKMMAQAAPIQGKVQKRPKFQPGIQHPLGPSHCCGNCVFGFRQPEVEEAEEPNYECWRFPPTAHMVAAVVPTPMGPQMATQSGSTLPITPGSAFWCGECVPRGPQPEDGDRKQGCVMDTDGDGNCPHHPEGCPPKTGVDLASGPSETVSKIVLP